VVVDEVGEVGMVARNGMVAVSGTQQQSAPVPIHLPAAVLPWRFVFFGFAQLSSVVTCLVRLLHLVA